MHVDSQNLDRTSIALWLLKKIFPTPVVLSYMCVRYMHGVYARGALRVMGVYEFLIRAGKIQYPMYYALLRLNCRRLLDEDY